MIKQPFLMSLINILTDNISSWAILRHNKYPLTDTYLTLSSQHYPFNACVNNGAASINFNAFDMVRPEFEPMTYRSRSGRSTTWPIGVGFTIVTCLIIHYNWASLWENGLFAYAKTKTQISFAVTAKLISAFVFATRIVQSLYFLNPKFQTSSLLLWLHSLICVGPGRKPRRPVFSQRGSIHTYLLWQKKYIAHIPVQGKQRYPSTEHMNQSNGLDLYWTGWISWACRKRMIAYMWIQTKREHLMKPFVGKDWRSGYHRGLRTDGFLVRDLAGSPFVVA